MALRGNGERVCPNFVRRVTILCDAICAHDAGIHLPARHQKGGGAVGNERPWHTLVRKLERREPCTL